jgi:hypothetical protein
MKKPENSNREGTKIAKTFLPSRREKNLSVLRAFAVKNSGTA